MSSSKNPSRLTENLVLLWALASSGWLFWNLKKLMSKKGCDQRNKAFEQSLHNEIFWLAERIDAGRIVWGRDFHNSFLTVQHDFKREKCRTVAIPTMWWQLLHYGMYFVIIFRHFFHESTHSFSRLRLKHVTCVSFTSQGAPWSCGPEMWAKAVAAIHWFVSRGKVVAAWMTRSVWVIRHM